VALILPLPVGRLGDGNPLVSGGVLLCTLTLCYLNSRLDIQKEVKCHEKISNTNALL
jgi:hypothetical protein